MNPLAQWHQAVWLSYSIQLLGPVHFCYPRSSLTPGVHQEAVQDAWQKEHEVMPKCSLDIPTHLLQRQWPRSMWKAMVASRPPAQRSRVPTPMPSLSQLCSPPEMPSRLSALSVLSILKTHFKAHLFQEVCLNLQATMASHLKLQYLLFSSVMGAWGIVLLIPLSPLLDWSVSYLSSGSVPLLYVPLIPSTVSM